MTQPRSRRATIVLALLAGALVLTSPANASVGVGVGAATLSPRGDVRPASIVTLPPWWLQNTGTHRMDYQLRAAPHAAPHEKAAAAPGQVAHEWLVATAPDSSTDTSSTFVTTVTWTATP